MSKADEIREQIAALQSKLHEAEEAERREKGRARSDLDGQETGNPRRYGRLR